MHMLVSQMFFELTDLLLIQLMMIDDTRFKTTQLSVCRVCRAARKERHSGLRVLTVCLIGQISDVGWLTQTGRHPEISQMNQDTALTHCSLWLY